MARKNKTANKVLLIALVAVGALMTAQLWGGCNLNYRLCTARCTLQHFNSAIQEAACKTGCAAEKAGCAADRGARKASDFLNRIQDTGR